MAGFHETATERLLREMRDRDRLFEAASGTLRTLRDHRGGAFDVMRDAMRETSLVDRLARGQTGTASEHLARIATGLAPVGSSNPRTTTTIVRETAQNKRFRSVADLGPLIRTARRAMKMTQAEFAAHAGVGRRFLSELEGGKRSLEFDKVMDCAAAAGIDLFARARHR